MKEAWRFHGGETKTIESFWRFEGSGRPGDGVFGGNYYCQVLAERIGLELALPNNLWLTQLSKFWTKRSIRLARLEEVRWPAFVKPIDHECFPAGIYRDADSLLQRAWSPLMWDQLILLSEIVEIEAEVRTFVANGELKALGSYSGKPSLSQAAEFISSFLDSCNFGMACTIDLARIKGSGWALLEFNPCWASEIYSCDPKNVIRCIQQACAFPRLSTSNSQVPKLHDSN